ncbi:MAG: ATP-binding protein [candidate division KSB1 bacterium]|nr:ATP-binding protein [candidate division KSB1 bacterium]MDZ7367734.1 ATP-binding protein [candidate division KSB1 bacterium]MDZ7406300.1 ATP-binding protein [candidate division KSB1 bacterium]
MFRPIVFNIPVTIALVLLMIFSSVGVVMTFAFYRYEKEELTQYIRSQFIALADGLAPLVEEAYLRKNFHLVQETLQVFVQHGEITFAVVVDADGMIVASEPAMWRSRPFDEFLAEYRLTLFKIPQPNRLTTHFSMPPSQHLFLFDRQFHEANRLRGRLLLGYNSMSVEMLVGKRLRNVLILGGLILLAGAVAFYLVVHLFLIRPMRAMGQVMHEVADGNLDGRCPDFNGLPAVKNLIRQFNDMLAVRKMVEAMQRSANEEMQKLQQQLFQAQKMETIGTLAGGIAHDFNNLLVGILGTASLMKTAIDRNSLLHEHIQTIEQAALRASELTKQLLGFARAGKYEVHSVNLNDTIEELMKLISRTLDKDIAVTAQFADDLWLIEGDGNQLHQALLNICLNARDAMPNGGTLMLATENLEIETKTSSSHFNVAPGKYVHVVISDTGIGMDAATQARIFEPFFSTKERGKGTGLGLAMVYGIVRNHGGRIYVESAIGKGSSFHIYFPATQLAAVIPRPSPQLEAPPGRETILLIDDERVILDVASRILKQLGYGVLLAREGQEALRLFAERRHEIALVILDMVMPRLSGREVFRRLKEIDPQVRVLLSSGYSADGDAQAILNEGVIGFVQKPYLVSDLARAVKRALKPNEAAVE